MGRQGPSGLGVAAQVRTAEGCEAGQPAPSPTSALLPSEALPALREPGAPQ